MEEISDTELLYNIISSNPDLPIVILVNNDEIAGDYGSTVFETCRVYVSEVYKYERYGDILWSDDEDEVIEYFEDYFADDENYKGLSDSEYHIAIKEYVYKNVEHYKAIVIYGVY